MAKKAVMEGNNLEIKDYRFFQFKVFLVFTTPVIFLSNLVLAIFFASEIPSFALYSFIPIYFLYGLTIFVFLKYRYRFPKFNLSRDKISFTFHKKPYFETDLNSIKEITIIKNSVESLPKPYSISKSYDNYSIQFKFKDSEKEIKLWCCGFNMRKQLSIIDSLINLGEKLNKPVKIYDAREIIIREKESPCWEIQNFLKKSNYFQ